MTAGTEPRGWDCEIDACERLLRLQEKKESLFSPMASSARGAPSPSIPASWGARARRRPGEDGRGRQSFPFARSATPSRPPTRPSVSFLCLARLQSRAGAAMSTRVVTAKTRRGKRILEARAPKLVREKRRQREPQGKEDHPTGSDSRGRRGRAGRGEENGGVMQERGSGGAGEQGAGCSSRQGEVVDGGRRASWGGAFVISRRGLAELRSRVLGASRVGVFGACACSLLFMFSLAFLTACVRVCCAD